MDRQITLPRGSVLNVPHRVVGAAGQYRQKTRRHCRRL